MINEDLQRYLDELKAALPLPHYVQRRFTAASSGGEVPLEDYHLRGVFREQEPELREVLKHSQILILAEPGAGKSMVARAAVHELIRAGNKIPVFAELKSYRRPLTDILSSGKPADLFVQDLVVEGIARQRAYILDGLDEIPIEGLADFKADFEQFLTTEPDATVLITARQAFFVANKAKVPLLSTIFHILDFSDDDIHEYLTSSGVDAARFKQEINRVDANEDVRNPFILSVLAQRFRQAGFLSPLRSENLSYVVNHLIQSRPAVNQHTQRRALQMMGIALEVYSRNELTQQECTRLFRDARSIGQGEAESILNELYASILKRTANGLAFQLRSHGEYLAAEELEKEPLSRIRELAFLDYNTPNDSWMNAISYLCELNAEVRKYFAREFPFWTIDASPAAFSGDEKMQILTGVLDTLVSERQYATGDPRFKLRKLSRFVTVEAEARLAGELASADHIRKGNALALLGILQKVPDLEPALELTLDLAQPIGLRYSGIVALVNSGNSDFVPRLIAGINDQDVLKLNVLDCIGALAAEHQLSVVFPIIFHANGGLSSTYYHMSELRSRLALTETLRYFVAHPQEMNTIRAGGYVEPLLGLIENYFDDEIAGLCADLFLMLDQSHVYVDRSSPIPKLIDSIQIIDRKGVVAVQFFERILDASRIPGWHIYGGCEFIVSVMTIESAQWLVDHNAVEIVQALAGYLNGEIRELLRPYSAGVIDAQDQAARAYHANEREHQTAKKTRIEALQNRLITRDSLQNALADFNDLTPDHWPELRHEFRQWLEGEINQRLVALNLEQNIMWRGDTLWEPPELWILAKLIDRYELRVQPDEPLVWIVTGWDHGTVLNHVRRYEITPAAINLLERLIADPPSPQSHNHLIEFVEKTSFWSDSIDESLRRIVIDPLPEGWVKVRALNLLANHNVEDQFLDQVRQTADAELSQAAFELLVQRLHRPTIERGLAAVSTDHELRAAETESSRDTSLSWIVKVSSDLYWDKLAKLRERALRLELPQVTGLITNALKTINRARTAELIRSQIALSPPSWRETQQHHALMEARAARIEQAQLTSFDEVLRKLRRATSINRLRLFCEGSSDVPVFRALLAQAPGTPEIPLDFVGGWPGLRDKDPNSFLLGAKEAIVVMDGDNGRCLTTVGQPYTGAAERELQRLSRVGVVLRVLKRYGIENYFPQAAIESVTRSDLSRFFPIPDHVSATEHLSEGTNDLRYKIRRLAARIFQLSKPKPTRTLYSKNHNRELALLLSLENDLRGTDLYDIVHEISRKAIALLQD